MRGQPRAETSLRERVLRDRERGGADAAVALEPAEALAGGTDCRRAVDDGSRRLLDEVAVPARAHVPEVPVAQEAGRRSVRATHGAVRAAQRDPVVVERSLRAVRALRPELPAGLDGPAEVPEVAAHERVP